ncbi:MAG TPA: enoyl-ACP reductase [Planctomycetes bacterium]|nr:enoyl-ACP reductase [Planctomycetota bacterium]HIL36955.1 enoyl-ACP reductase [Planctomycetota bacterium]
MTRFLEGKTSLVLGVANKRSLAWGCARSLSNAGMRVALTYASERLEKNVRELAEELPGSICVPCDVTRPEEIDSAFETVGAEFGGLDALVHAIAFAKREELQGNFFETTKEGYMLAHEVSAYSLTAVARRALPLMKDREGSIVTLSYLGSERVIPNYNIMGIAKAALEASVRYLAADLGPRGIRVNAISAGPIKTLSAAGVGNFSELLASIEGKAPLRRNVTSEEVGDTCQFLCGPQSRGITGSVIFVDAGFHIMG